MKYLKMNIYPFSDKFPKNNQLYGIPKHFVEQFSDVSFVKI